MTARIVIAGLGMVSPLGMSAEEHAFLARANAGPAAPGGFVTPEGETVTVSYCPTLGATMPLAARIGALASSAAARALAELPAPPSLLTTWLVTASPELSVDATTALRGLGAVVRVVQGAAELFRALDQATDMIEGGRATMALVVAADSLVDAAVVTRHVEEAKNPWAPALLDASEGAAAFLLMTREEARRLGIKPRASLLRSAALAGSGNDDDDAIVDGVALTTLFRGMAERARGRFAGAFGPVRAGSLRRREWDLATARTASLFADDLVAVCAEEEVGSIGAASGGMNLALAVAAIWHGALPDPELSPIPGGAPVIAWAISADGVRGACVISGEPGQGARTATSGALRRVLAATDPVPVLAVLAVQVDPAAEDADAPGDEIPAEVRVPSEAALTAVVVDPERAAPSPWHEHCAEVAEGCLERVSMFAQHRMERPLSVRPRVEARLLAQLDALAMLGTTPTAVLTFAEERSEDGDLWALGAAVLALGTSERPEAGVALVELARAVPPSDEAVQIVASMLGIAPLADPVALAHALRDSKRPASRALGIALGARVGALSDGTLVERLGDARAHPLEIAAAFRALARGTGSDNAAACARRILSSTEDAAVAWEASRAALLWGLRDPLDDLRTGGRLAAILGVRALDLLVLGGKLDDVGVLETLLGRLPVSEDTLDAVARFGHPGSWAYLVHHLTDGELADAAGRALSTLFGPLVDEGHSPDAAVWRAAIARIPPTMDCRLRRGKSWSVGAILAECASGELSAREARGRLDEGRAHAGRVPDVDLEALGHQQRWFA